MFKYVSDILKNFSMSQRIIALILLLFTIVIVLTGPKIVDSLTKDNTELIEKIEIQDLIIGDLKKDINNLNVQVDTLNNILRLNQIECTNQIIKREKEIMVQLSTLERNVINSLPVRMMDDSKSSYEYDESSVNAILGIQSIRVGIEKSINSKK